jgi:hypothetical protein
MKTTLKLIAILLTMFIAFSFWMSPRLGGLLNFGKEKIDKEVYILNFDSLSTKNHTLMYKDISEREDLHTLRKEYNLDDIIRNCTSDFEKVLKIQSWVQSRWKHNSDNVPTKNDALYYCSATMFAITRIYCS